jgi:hypothetical protein
MIKINNKFIGGSKNPKRERMPFKIAVELQVCRVDKNKTGEH